MPVDAAHIESLIRQAMPNAEVTVEDLRGDGNYLAAHVISPGFAGLSRIQQHRLVYRALGGSVGTDLHALSLHTSAPRDN